MEHGHGGIPVVVLYQAINVGTLFLVLFFLLRKKVASALHERGTTHETKVKSARQVVEDAEKKNREVKSKIKTIETGRTKALEEARRNAEELKQKIIQDSKAQSEQLKQDAQRTVQYEFEKAKNDLRSEMLEEVLKASQANISTKATGKKLETLNKEFIDGVRVN